MKEALWMLRHIKRSCSFLRDVSNFNKTFFSWQKFWKDYHYYQKVSLKGQKALLAYLHPCLGDDTVETEIDPIYFYQDTWAFEKIIRAAPSHHIDVGSHHKFVAFLSKVFPVTMIDIRPLALSLDTLNFKEGSILDLPFSNESVESLSSLCVVEHIGLGRYGDPLDPLGSEKAVAELCRVICPNGHLYISVPIDDCNQVFFNAHRAFEETYFESLLSPLKIIEKKYILGEKLLAEKPIGFSIALYHAVKEAEPRTLGESYGFS
jgi:SAM-dependent methyltransferase